MSVTVLAVRRPFAVNPIMLRLKTSRRAARTRLVPAALASLVMSTVVTADAAEKSAVRSRDLALAIGEPLNVRMLAQQQPVTPPTYDSEPEFVEGRGGGFVAWHSFAPGAERIVGRPLRDAADVPYVDLAGGTGVFTPPEMAAAEDGRIAVAWSTWRDGRWSIAGRQRSADRWSDVTPLSSPNLEAVHPAIESLDRGGFAV